MLSTCVKIVAISFVPIPLLAGRNYEIWNLMLAGPAHFL